MLEMENCFCSTDWPQEASCVQSQDGLEGTETSYLVPFLPPGEYVPFEFDGYPSWSMPYQGGIEEDRAAATAANSSKSHSQAEKRRRDRINAQLATLRKLIPRADKMDKAALLGSAVDRLKDLKRKAFETNKVFTIPSETDEVTVDCSNFGKNEKSPINSQSSPQNIVMIKASLCCDDRPELLAELSQALKGLKLRTVQADMSCLGGRIRSILILSCNNGEDNVCTKNLKQSLKVALNRIVSSSSTNGLNYRIKSKRQKFFFASH